MNQQPLTEAELYQHSIPRLMPYLNALRRYHRHQVVGLEHIPTSGGGLVIPNHCFATYDVLLIGALVFETYGRVIRGLTDRFAFKVPVVRSLVRLLGMVEAGMENALRLLGIGELLGIVPGGMREALRGHQQRYQINWAGRYGFARLAIAAQCPIILSACPRADEIYTVHAGKLTELAYRRLKIPVVLPVGLAGTLIPRPIQLTHYFSPPIHPPKIAQDDPKFESEVVQFQRYVAARMEALLADALHASDREGHSTPATASFTPASTPASRS